jgi:hypothetical protein
MKPEARNVEIELSEPIRSIGDPSAVAATEPNIGEMKMRTASSDVRKSRLATAVQQEVVRGGRVESSADYSAIIRFEKPVNNTLHLLLTIFTLGVWATVWIVLAIISSMNKKSVSLVVDDYGQLLRQEI